MEYVIFCDKSVVINYHIFRMKINVVPVNFNDFQWCSRNENHVSVVGSDN